MTYANRRVFVVVPAAGCGSRMQSDRPKQYLPLGQSGQTVLQTTVLTLLDVPEIDGIYVAVSPEDEYAETLAIPAAVLRTGGKTRAETVYQTLEALSDTIADDDLVLVHDAARPFVQPQDVSNLIVRTQKGIEEGMCAGMVLATDESSAMRSAGYAVGVVESSSRNIKLTRPQDIEDAKIYMENSMKIRVGIGYDSHRLVEGRKFILGGIEVEHTLGLDGHSDADALLHAITDAILGAARLGNIGTFFPDTDPKYKGADSAILLKDAYEAVREAGWRVVNIDAVVVAQKPKLNPHVATMQARVEEILEIEEGSVSIKPKTNEKLGFEGREEGVSTQAVVLLQSDC